MIVVCAIKRAALSRKSFFDKAICPEHLSNFEVGTYLPNFLFGKYYLLKNRFGNRRMSYGGTHSGRF